MVTFEGSSLARVEGELALALAFPITLKAPTNIGCPYAVSASHSSLKAPLL
jgi:hypothetical protein